ncbi:MAG: hypothetical protein V1738_01395 [Patescibacteria group bacterium]
MDRSRLSAQDMTISQLIDDLTAELIPIMARLTSEREYQFKKASAVSADGGNGTTVIPEMKLDDLWASDVFDYSIMCHVFVTRWLRVLERRYRPTGLGCGLLDDRMLPNDFSDEEFSEQFRLLSILHPVTQETDVELLSAIFRYFKHLHCPERDVPWQMIRLLELNFITLDITL